MKTFLISLKLLGQLKKSKFFVAITKNDPTTYEKVRLRDHFLLERLDFELFQRALLFILFFSLGVQAKSTSVSQCSKNELQRKDCLLHMNNSSYRFNHNHLSIVTKTWKAVHDLPLSGESLDWESVRVFDLMGRRFYEFKIWGDFETEAKIQSLHWFLVELEGTKATLKLDKIIQKRRPILNGEGTVTDRYLKDKQEKHQVVAKNKKIIWLMGSDKGEL
ncbi:MAG: hypothetical protein KDD34_04970 [Bdellovibrionales bacterium]|nr:hypothetical protein [Bdellovibrionales bacterium]